MEWIGTVLLQAAGDGKGDAGWLTAFFPLIAIAVIFYFLILRPQRREQATRESMLSTLKKNDKVVTIGGIIGSVANNVSQDDKEVTLKVDDNTRIKFLRSSIQRVIVSEADGDKPGEKENR